MPTFGSCENIPMSCTLWKSKGKSDVRSLERSDIPIGLVGLSPPNLCIKAFLTLWIYFSLDVWMIILLRGWILYNIKLYIVVILVLQKCNEMCFSFSVWIHLDEHSGSLECVTALFVYLNACDNIRGSILPHFGDLPLALHRSRIGPDVVQILKKYHVCCFFFSGLRIWANDCFFFKQSRFCTAFFTAGIFA